MSKKIQALLEGKGGNYIFPFFWQHGETEEVLRKYMQVIHDANIGAVCVESRPHPDFCGPQWWHDMDIIIEEARKYNMKIWILDDSHFPTGFANGAMKEQPAELLRQSITCRQYPAAQGETVTISAQDLHTAAPFEPNMMEQMMMHNSADGATKQFDDDRMLGVYAIRMDGISGFQDEDNRINLMDQVTADGLTWTAPEGEWKIYVTQLTRNRGPHRDYINMMDKESCQVQIKAVYEPHWEHYREEFGKTIAGFFSDEPELGNGHLYEHDNGMGCKDSMDFPWSRELEAFMENKLGPDYPAYLGLLWENGIDDEVTAEIRYPYMDVVSRLVEQDFSYPLGEWCRAHGVEYIGHLIEDNNHDSKTGSSLGHYFRGLAGQNMAGIDDIGGQVMPGQEDVDIKQPPLRDRNGSFYHYGLGKLGSSAAAIEPLKQGNSMCEIFGAYGWAEGVRLEKYLIDHFMVRGINHYVPHAFSGKDFPDPDCPPHFYAHGHNPQYRHFGALMAYSNRVLELINGGTHTVPVAVLYHGESNWMGQAMASDQVGHQLYDNQIDYDFIPQDVFLSDNHYQMSISKGSFTVNTQSYQALVVPKLQFVTPHFAKGVQELQKQGFPVFFVEEIPVVVGQEIALEGTVVTLDTVAQTIRAAKLAEVSITPANNRVRYYHYNHSDGDTIYMFINEGDSVYQGVVNVADTRACLEYDAWNNEIHTIQAKANEVGTTLELTIEPLKSVLVVFDAKEKIEGLLAHAVPKVTLEGEELTMNGTWTRSICKSISYPEFAEKKEVTIPDQMAEEYPVFSGFARYENTFTATAGKKYVLEITDAYEGVEVFVNGKSLGIQIVPDYVFDLSKYVVDGTNELAIEVATTLERETSTIPNPYAKYIGADDIKPTCPSGINGEVKLFAQ